MANTDLIVPLIVAGIGLVGTIFSLLWGWWLQKRSDERKAISDADNRRLQEQQDMAEKRYNEEITSLAQKHEMNLATFKTKLEELSLSLQQRQKNLNLTAKYKPPLLVAAYDLQQRLYELLEYPISRQHVTYEDGLDDMKKFSCYLLAQYLAYSYILRTKTGYLSFTDDKQLKEIRSMMYTIDQELDQRRDEEGNNIGVWPGDRVMIAERMIKTDSKQAMTESLDGGYGLEVKGYDEFTREWKTHFQKPMGFFCKWIDDILLGRKLRKEYLDAAPRCTQHLLLDLIFLLDSDRDYVPVNERKPLQCEPSSRGCDCMSCEESRKGKPLSRSAKFKKRQDSRYCEMGIWHMGGKDHRKYTRKERWPRSALWTNYYEPTEKGIEEFDLEKVQSMTVYPDLI